MAFSMETHMFTGQVVTILGETRLCIDEIKHASISSAQGNMRAKLTSGEYSEWWSQGFPDNSRITTRVPILSASDQKIVDDNFIQYYEEFFLVSTCPYASYLNCILREDGQVPGEFRLFALPCSLKLRDYDLKTTIPVEYRGSVTCCPKAIVSDLHTVIDNIPACLNFICSFYMCYGDWPCSLVKDEEAFNDAVRSSNTNRLKLTRFLVNQVNNVNKEEEISPLDILDMETITISIEELIEGEFVVPSTYLDFELIKIHRLHCQGLEVMPQVLRTDAFGIANIGCFAAANNRAVAKYQDARTKAYYASHGITVLDYDSEEPDMDEMDSYYETANACIFDEIGPVVETITDLERRGVT
jgi:hypothetical protein